MLDAAGGDLLFRFKSGSPATGLTKEIPSQLMCEGIFFYIM